MTVVDTIFKALAPAMPGPGDRRPSRRPRASASINGRAPKDDSFFIYLGGLIGGGWGAKHNERRHERHHRDERRRHPQRPVRAGRGQVSRCWSSAIACAPDSGGAGTYPRRPRHRAGGAGAAPIRFIVADGPRATASRGACTAACRASATRSRCIASARPRRRISRTARRSTRCCSRATPTSCAPAAAAATARRWSAISTTLEHDVRCGYVTQEAAEEILRRGVQGRHAGDRRRGDREQRADMRARACRTTSRSPR